MWTDIRPTPIPTSREKFIELRLRTDRDLKFLVEKALNRGHHLLERGQIEKAEGTYALAVALLSLVHTLPVPERQQLGGRIRQLRAELDETALGQRLAS